MKATPVEFMMIEKILQEGRNLNTWESDFVASLDEQLGSSGTLSEKQSEILERIYAEKTP